MNTVELFCGTKSFSKVAKELGHNTFTVDIDPNLDPNLVCDIMDFQVSMIPFDKVDVLWMSPPCTKFSIAAVYRNWKDGRPTNQETLDAIKLVKKSLFIKDVLLLGNPDMKWYLENPRGMLRKQDFMQGMKRNTIIYCKYGAKVQKPTDIWTNDYSWIPKPMCKPMSPCHERVPRGSQKGTQGISARRLKQLLYSQHKQFDIILKRDALERGVIPPNLFYEIFRSKSPIKIQEQLTSVVEVVH